MENFRKFNESNNNNKKLFIDSLETLFYAGGGDTPHEVVWGCNGLLEWYEKEFGVSLDRFTEDDDNNFDNVISSIKK